MGARNDGTGSHGHEHGHDGHHHGHDSGHAHHHHHHHEVQGNILVAFLLNLGFSLIELVGGLATNSMAILSDSVHDLGDALVIGIAWRMERKSGKGADARHSYGYRRWSVLGALVTTVVLLAGSVAVVVTAIPRILFPVPVDDGGMAWLAVLGIAMNGLAAWRTSGGYSLGQRAVSLHMLEDVLGWVAVLVGSLLIRLTGWTIIDPLLSVAIAAFVARGAVANLLEVMPIFLEEVPDGMSAEEIAREVAGHVDGVADAHHVHIWRLDEETALATLHVSLDDEADAEVAKAGVRKLLAGHGISHATIETEPAGMACPDPCAI